MTTRSSLYRIASFLGDVQAVQKSARQRSVKPIARRYVRKNVYRVQGKLTRKALKGLGL